MKFEFHRDCPNEVVLEVSAKVLEVSAKVVEVSSKVLEVSAKVLEVSGNVDVPLPAPCPWLQ